MVCTSSSCRAVHSYLRTEGVPYALSPRRQTKVMSTETYRQLADTICLRFPSTPIHRRSDRAVLPGSLPLDYSATFFEYVVVDGKRYYASRMVGWNKSSFVHVVIPGTSLTDACGEILEVFQFDQDFRQAGCPLWLARVRWFRPWSGEHEGIWDNL